MFNLGRFYNIQFNNVIFQVKRYMKMNIFISHCTGMPVISLSKDIKAVKYIFAALKCGKTHYNE